MKTLQLGTAALLGLMAAALTAASQTPADPKAQPPGTVLFERHADQAAPMSKPPASSAVTPTDDERAAVTITSYDLDTRLTPATGGLAVRAHLTLRNEGTQPLARIALQISSTLHWESATLVAAGVRTPLVVAGYRVETDADHTGAVEEGVFALPQPLAVGASLTLDTFYSGTIPQSAERLRRIGASAAQGAEADWDCICAGGTGLRGFGNVLWYPVASQPLFLGDGAKLFQAVGLKKLQGVAATMQVRLAIQYEGSPPVAIYFAGRRAELHAVSDDAALPGSSVSGLVSASFPVEPLGFRLPSLFLIARPEDLIAPLDGTALLAVETANTAALPRLTASAEQIAPLLQRWFGPRPLTAVTVIDQPGQPFEDGPLVVAPLDALAASDGSAALAHSLTHAWVQTGQPWMDEGLAQFVALLWTEQQHGREAAIAQLAALMRPVALAEPVFDASVAEQAWPNGQPLITSSDEVFYRRKAGAVWWMLHDIAGDPPLQQALSAWRVLPVSREPAETQALGFERLLEKTSGKDLRWFFQDWVLRDRGLPDLTITEVTVLPRPAGPGGRESGWLVSLTVKNEGGAAADVPVVIRSSSFSITQRLHVPGLDTTTFRTLVEGAPTEVVVNDGTTPELRTSVHSKTVVPR